jgi:hypothetical protein
MTPKFTGTITNRKPLFDEPQQCQNYVNGLEGKDFELTLKVRRDARARNQMAYYWGKEKAISGCTHDLFKDDFFDNYIRKIQAWYAQEFGGIIPDPKEAEL